jgi:CRISPR/Cas system CSM-associated protein Csm3 (group 7 of RAMP superfamily)
MAPLREDRIVWVNSTGRVEEKRLLLPGSAIKGAIRHRVTFHHNRLEGQFANHLAKGCNNDEQGHQDAQTKLRPVTGLFNQAVCDLFGFVPDKHDGDKREDAARGRVLIDDLFWSGTAPHQQRIPHVSIDRFTGGASDGRLFDERPLWKGDSFPTLKLTILNADDVPAGTRKALKAALDDLANGRLALGAGGGRGLGFFEPNDKPENAVTCTPTGWFDSADGESSQNPANPDAASPANLQPAPSHAH